MDFFFILIFQHALHNDTTVNLVTQEINLDYLAYKKTDILIFINMTLT